MLRLPTTHKALGLPPGFSAREDDAPWSAAIAAAEAGQAPGTLVHAPIAHTLEAAVILAPDRPVEDDIVLRLATLAVRNALLAVVPPETAVTALATGTVTLNCGEVASSRVARGPALPDGVPSWIVLGLTVRMALKLEAPGETPWMTDLAEEGIDVSGPELLGAICRHLLSLIDLWSAKDAPGITSAWRDALAMQPA